MNHTPSILFLSKSRQAASTRYRVLDYFSRFREAGWAPTLLAEGDAGVSHRTILRQARRADVVVVCRKTFTGPFRYLLRRAARRLVFDFDDAVFTTPRGESSTRKRRFAAMARHCDAIWAGNLHLADTARRYQQDVTVLPTAIEPDSYRGPNTPPEDVFNVVWIGSSSTRRYLETALPGLESASRKVPNLRLKIVADFDLPDAPIPTHAVRWTREGEAAELRNSHLGIAPMPDTPYTRGKCGLKVLQYMAASIPVVASDTGVHLQIVLPDQTGILASTPEQWADAIAHLHRHADTARAMGVQGNRRVNELYAFDATFEVMQRSLQALCQ
jgi:glycosyltransferase involved in cell wall biosynthesis